MTHRPGLLGQDRPILVPDVHDVLTAKVVAAAGFRTVRQRRDPGVPSMHQEADHDWPDVSRTLRHHSIGFAQARAVSTPGADAAKRILTAMNSL